MAGRLFIGTSGWHYGSWLGPFYPERHPKPKLLAFYAGVFDTTEINLSFYRLPTEAAVAAWRDGTPDDFVFAWKAHRVITHYRRLTNPEEPIANVFARMAGLGPKGGPVLFQLPPRFRANRERLAAFLSALPPGGRYTVEFRDPSWYEPAILDLLAEFDAALCISDHAHAPSPWVATASFVYVRGHGPSGRYHGSYDDAALADWAGHVARWRAEGRDVFSFFDNDIKAAAPADAQRLAALTGQTPERLPGP
ncbi:MAG: hypothetical protein JWR08_1580 [Enterovirga sp.]|jgi:uncharacterized protein YecE (DUF72 family)|nr:hypothetical protein [Enterovirga sp.]